MPAEIVFDADIDIFTGRVAGNVVTDDMLQEHFVTGNPWEKFPSRSRPGRSPLPILMAMRFTR
ncbi:MAG: hypothetical protein ACXVKL_09680 [Candidatus Angelobacter sp.]